MARPKYPSDDADKTMVRFPKGLMPRLKEAAAANGRSMNSEIIARLEASFPASAPDPYENPETIAGLKHDVQSLTRLLADLAPGIEAVSLVLRGTASGRTVSKETLAEVLKIQANGALEERPAPPEQEKPPRRARVRGTVLHEADTNSPTEDTKPPNIRHRERASKPPSSE